ncbi:MAG: hypothetical protein ACSLEZ_14420 [Thiobacillus sp.]
MIQREPVLSSGAIAGAVGAVLVALVSLGLLDLTPEQQAAVLAALVAVLPIAMALWARAQVTPLINATDVDGESLTRWNGMPAIAEQKAMGFTPEPVPDRGRD